MKKFLKAASKSPAHIMLYSTALLGLPLALPGLAQTTPVDTTPANAPFSTPPSHPDTQETGTVGADPAAVADPSIYHLYVSPSGDDNNPGTASAPFRTINRAAMATKPSTTVHVAQGVYSGNVITKNSGKPNARIRFVADTKWSAKIIGSGSEAHWTNSGDHVDVIGFDISGPGRLGILNYASNTLLAGNHVHDLKVSGGCTGSGGAGIVNAGYKASDDDIIGNVVHDIGVPGKCNGVQGIYHSNLRGTIANNIVYRVSAWGIHLWHAANNVLVANNTVFANGSASMGGGIEIGSGDSPGGITVTNTKVINNIVYQNPGASIAQFCYGGHNCIGANNVTSNNLVYGNGRPISLRSGSATATVAADPQFVDYRANGGGNYRLRAGSPAINGGTLTAAPAFDIDNVVRPKGGGADIGAYEND